MLFRSAEGQALVYVPIDIPLADVVNAWMFTEDSQDRQKLIQHAGLLRTTGEDQLYKLYDTESYQCNSFDSNMPTRPYLVTTDILWEVFASAYEGTFIVRERQQAMPSFWAFVTTARQSLDASSPHSTWAQAFDAVNELHSDSKSLSEEAQHIQKAEGGFHSAVFGEPFDFAELKPRGHYASTPEMAEYFKAVHYLTTLAAKKGATDLNSLPPAVKAKAAQWIAAYDTYIAPSRAPLVWNREASTPPVYARHPSSLDQIFPLSWGFDNEVLLSTVYHDKWPVPEQITGSNGPRNLPSGVDLAAALGSGYARSLLKTDLTEYPALGPVLDALHKRRPNEAVPSNLYNAWTDALAVQWADGATFPGLKDDALWKAKRLQTGLASWATLRHATVLVNERSDAEAGEGGFEAIIMRPPRGYVEPDPKTFQAIASLFDELEKVVAASTSLEGTLPDPESSDKAAEPLYKGISRRLTASAKTARQFAAIANKELQNQELTNAEYEAILYVGGAAEHDFLIYKSLANKDLALSNPDPMMKIADVAGGPGAGGILEAAVGRPLEWDQTVPYFGRREIVKGSVYSYYEFPSSEPMSDADWIKQLGTMPAPEETPKAHQNLPDPQPHPGWVKEFITTEPLSCPVRAPF